MGWRDLVFKIEGQLHKRLLGWGVPTVEQAVAGSQAAMQEVAVSQTAIDAIGSNANENIAEITVLNSATATIALQDTNLDTGFNDSFSDGYNAGGGVITNSRVLVTSNNDDGDSGTGISFDTDVSSEYGSGRTFIINGANVNQGSISFGGSVGLDGIEIN